MPPETPHRGHFDNQQSFQTPNQLVASANQPHLTSSSRRQPPRSNTVKLNTIFDAIEKVGWDVPKFLAQLFQKEKLDERHERVVKSMLNGTTKPYLGTILKLLYEDAQRTTFLKNDTSTPPGTNMFMSNLSLDAIRHGYPALVTWATTLVSRKVSEEADHMISRDMGLHLWAQVKEGGRGKNEEYKVSWDKVNSFSLSAIRAIANENAPIMSFLLNSYITKERHPVNFEDVVQVYRPEDGVTLNTLMSLTFGHSNRASLYALCRGIWLFAVKAPSTVFRVESRIGQSVSYQTVYQALRQMAKQKKEDLRAAIEAGHHFIVVSDNIQAYARQRDHRIGKENRMITGLAATAVEMEDYHPEAFDMNDIVQRQKQQERKKLTTDLILEDIEAQHLENVAVVHFLQRLLNFVPALLPYRQKLREYVASSVSKNQIPKMRRTKVTPLATNSANEMLIQGMKEGILDFASTQMGMKTETLNNVASIWSGDGKTFNMLLSLKKMSAMESDDFHSFR
ncbi:hypothetical protein BYT27DRAFT_7282405 [Phlegmacium glaucopus]|nr:hypothetical protein BYT27DRAFT_7282405 [Phlegmacium glaucopus]